MQEHHYAVEVDGPPEAVWGLFWRRTSFRGSGPVSIDILHPGDDVGEGLVRHCTFAVPRYLLSGGVGHSWEWLTEVRPPVSWKYDAVGKPLWSKAEGRTRLEDLGDGRTRIHFTETYHAFNPVVRRLLEQRVHRFISKDNDRLIAEAINGGLRAMPAQRPEGSGVTVVDLWVNALTPEAARDFTGQEENAGIGDLLGGDLRGGGGLARLVADMDDAGVDIGVLAAGLSSAAGADTLLEQVRPTGTASAWRWWRTAPTGRCGSAPGCAPWRRTSAPPSCG